MSGIENNGFSIGRKQKMDFENFNGIQKNDFGTKVSQKLTDSVFSKYDKNNDNILDEAELKEMQQDIEKFAKNDNLDKLETKKFFKSLGLEKGHELKQKDLYDFLQTIQADTDSVSSAVTGENGETTVVYKPDANNITKTERYTMDSDGNKTLIEENEEGENYKKTTSYDENGKTVTETNDGKTTVSQYDADGNLTKTIETNNNTVVTTEYGENGEITEKYREKGTVKEFLDENNRVTQKITTKGDGITETVDFTYNDDGSVIETKTENGIKTEVHKDSTGQTLKTITQNQDGSTTEITTLNGQRVKTEKDKDGNITSKVNIDENGNPVSYKHTVQKGEYWYVIVQNKYGVSDHKTIMEIVHQLKDNAGVDYRSSLMPSEIELPPSITLKNGSTISLKNIDATVNETPAADTKIDVPEVPENLPQPVAESELPPKQISLPANEHITANPERANKSYVQDNGQTYSYDSNGRIIKIYDNQSDYYSLPSVIYSYKDDGSLESCQYNHYDAKGNLLQQDVYNSNGYLNHFAKNEDIDTDVINYNFGRQIIYTPQGNIEYFVECEHDENGRLLREERFNPTTDGFAFFAGVQYIYDGNQVKKITFDENGNID